MALKSPPQKDTSYLFTDGACSGNPGPGGYGSVLYLSESDFLELGGSEASTTNNRIEMKAILEGLKKLDGRAKNLWILTDSSYVIQGMTQWIHGWKRKNWQTSQGGDVQNRDLWESLDRAYQKISKSYSVEFKYLPGHSGIPGNERCDAIAVDFSKGSRPFLFSGPFVDYSVDIFDLPSDLSLRNNPNKKKKSSSKKAYSYLSYVNGVLRRHATWPECEAVVKGRSGVKFKKSVSKEDELEIIKSWGLKPSQLK